MLFRETTGRHSRSLQGYADVVKVLIENGADMNAVQKDKWSALHFVAQNGYVDIAKVLIQNGADVNAVERQRKALHYAAGRTC